MYDSSEVLKLARGRWDSIFRDLCQVDLSVQLKAGANVSVCPEHGGKGSFSFFPDWEETGGGGCFVCHSHEKMPYNGIGFLMWTNKWEFLNALNEVGEWVKADQKGFKKNAVQKPLREPPKIVVNVVQDSFNKDIWKQSLPSTHTGAKLLRNYLENRGLRFDRLPPNIRYHPKLEYRIFDKNGHSTVLGKWPCMVSPVQRLDGQLVGIHRTFLDPDTANKVVLPDDLSAKKLTRAIYKGCYVGSAIRFSPVHEPMVGVSEGIETALAVTAIIPIPFMAGISAHYLPTLQFAKETRSVKLFIDRDRSKQFKNKEVGRAGQLRGLQLAERLAEEGIITTLYMPPGVIEGKSRDWLDVYNQNGIRSMPKREDRLMLDAISQLT